ncbi:potassium voltage-gated channel subfamily C member 1 [Hydra vulgaris]|uniref:Potassium voltage-gated channel subfamily C member 1 n=1 Tax=Hydra vulgaris TaxID=6087 RepID=A0ABM4DL39_HYDVU
MNIHKDSSDRDHSKSFIKDTADRVVINIGGIKHECYISTIKNFPDTRLFWIAETALKLKESDSSEFFFDRHSGCFENILNYCRTGKLHCPNDVCGSLFEEELQFWGIDELMMEPCCWGGYTQHRDARQNLKMFDENIDDVDYHKKYSVGRKYSETSFQKYRPKIWALLERPFSSRYAQVVAFLSMMVIITSITTFCMQTVPRLFKYRVLFEYLEYCYCCIFTIEFFLRLACCPSYIAFFCSSLTYIDIISTLQFYIVFFAKVHALDFLFVFRLIRIFRLFRFFKQLTGMQIIVQTLKASMNELMLLLLLVTIPMVIFSTLIYYAEKNANVNLLTSIPDYFWWAIVTMTTVGYGDMVPNSINAKIVGAMCACTGLLIVALPVSVIGSNFAFYYSYAQARMKLPSKAKKVTLTVDKNLTPRYCRDSSIRSKRFANRMLNNKGAPGINEPLFRPSLKSDASLNEKKSSIGTDL